MRDLNEVLCVPCAWSSCGRQIAILRVLQTFPHFIHLLANIFCLCLSFKATRRRFFIKVQAEKQEYITISCPWSFKDERRMTNTLLISLCTCSNMIILHIFYKTPRNESVPLPYINLAMATIPYIVISFFLGSWRRYTSLCSALWSLVFQR